MRNAIIAYLKSGEKPVHSSALGVEAEHFIVYKDTKEAVPYGGEYGVRDIIKELMSRFPQSEPDYGEDILGFVTRDFAITLEPAAQLEKGV